MNRHDQWEPLAAGRKVCSDLQNLRVDTVSEIVSAFGKSASSLHSGAADRGENGCQGERHARNPGAD